MGFKLIWNTLKQRMRMVFPAQPEKKLEPDVLYDMFYSILTTRPDEIGCDECFEQLDRFIEITLAGKNAAEAMPLVQDHLDRCADCREEFEALLAALRAMA